MNENRQNEFYQDEKSPFAGTGTQVPVVRGSVAEYKKNLNVPNVLNPMKTPCSTPPVSTRIRGFKYDRGLSGKGDIGKQMKERNLLERKNGKATNDSLVPSLEKLIGGDSAVYGDSKMVKNTSIDKKYTKLKRKFLKHKKDLADGNQSDGQLADNEGSSQPSRADGSSQPSRTGVSSQPSRSESDSGFITDISKRPEFSLHERLERYMGPRVITAAEVHEPENRNIYELSQRTDVERQKVKRKLKTIKSSSGHLKHSTPILPDSPRKYIAPDNDDIDVEKGIVNTQLDKVSNSHNEDASKLEYEREITDINLHLNDDNIEDDIVIERVISKPQTVVRTDLNYKPSINLPGRPQRMDSIRTNLPSTSSEGKTPTKNTKEFMFQRKDTGSTESKAAKATESLNEAMELIMDIGSYISPIENGANNVTVDDELSTTGILTLEPDYSEKASKDNKQSNEPNFNDESIADADLSSVTYNFTWDSESQVSQRRGKRTRKKKRIKESSSGESEKYFDSGSSFYSGRVSRDALHDDLIRHVKSRESYC